MLVKVEAIKNGRLTLNPPIEIDGEILRHFGAVKSKAGWEFPLRGPDLDLLHSNGIVVELPESVQLELEKKDRLDSWLQQAKGVLREADHPSWNRLDPHQKVGVSWLASRDRALLGFWPGLGKTACAVVAAEVMGKVPALVVAPLTLLPTWEEEIRKWGKGHKVSNLRRGDPVLDGMGWNLINPEMLVRRKDLWYTFNTVIFDESVLYKNRKANRTKMAKQIGLNATTVWLLSGAPVTKYGDDYWAQLSILRPDVFRSYWRFVDQWCFTKQLSWGTSVVGNKHPAKLRHYLRDLVLLRDPTQVPVLPEQVVERVKVELNPDQKAILEDLKNFKLEGVTTPNILSQLTRMAQVISHPGTLGLIGDSAKLSTLLDMLEWVQKPLIVWCWFKPTAYWVAAELEHAGLTVNLVTGDTSSVCRQRYITDFQQGHLDALVMQIGTGKFGLSLTTAKTAIYYDRSFSLDDWIQSTARVRRRSSEWSVPTYVLSCGEYTDKLIEKALAKKLKSVADLGIEELKGVFK